MNLLYIIYCKAHIWIRLQISVDSESKKYFTKNGFTHRNKRKEKSRMSKIGVRRLRSRLTILYKKLYSYKHYFCLRKKIHPTG